MFCYAYHHHRAVLPVPRFSRGIGLVWIGRCGKNLAVAVCGFWVGFSHAVPLFWASFWSDKKYKQLKMSHMKVLFVAGAFS